MKSTFQHKFDGNHAQALSLGLSGASLVLPDAAAKSARWRPGNYLICSGDAQAPVARPMFTIIDSSAHLP